MNRKRAEDIECKCIQPSQAFRKPKWTMFNSQLLGGRRHDAGTGLLSTARVKAPPGLPRTRLLHVLKARQQQRV